MVIRQHAAKTTAGEHADCLHIRGEILKDFSAQVQQKPAFEGRFLVRMFIRGRLSGIVA